MNREKQIEEMASIAYPGLDHQTVFSSIVYAQPLVNLYNAGYRKQKEGEWVLIGNGNGRAIHWKCSVCGYETLDASNGDTNFCPNCGADMRGGE